MYKVIKSEVCCIQKLMSFEPDLNQRPRDNHHYSTVPRSANWAIEGIIDYVKFKDRFQLEIYHPNTSFLIEKTMCTWKRLLTYRLTLTYQMIEQLRFKWEMSDNVSVYETMHNV